MDRARAKYLVRYILVQRLFTFADEWALYIILLYLWTNENWIAFSIAAVLGATFILNSYRRLWKMEKNLFVEPVWADQELPQ